MNSKGRSTAAPSSANRRWFQGLVFATVIVFLVVTVPIAAQNSPPTSVREAAVSSSSGSASAQTAPRPVTRGSRPSPGARRGAPQGVNLYDNGPTNGTSDAYFIDVYVVSDSFVPSGGGSISFEIAVWTPTGATPLTADWALGTSSFGNDIGSGGGAWTSLTLLCSNGQSFNGGACAGGFGYDVYDAKMNASNVILQNSQTYWLTLTGATDNFNGRDAWDVNSGPSMAYHNLLGAVPSESFSVNGAAMNCNGYALDGNEPQAKRQQALQDKTTVAQAQSFQVIYNFTGGRDGAYPGTLTLDDAGNFYGTTEGGGSAANLLCQFGCGTVYKLSQQGAGWSVQPLYDFKGASSRDGSQPSSHLMLGTDGSLYGATASGGYCRSQHGCGTIFSLRPPNPPTGVRGGWSETVLYSFKGYDWNQDGPACSLQKQGHVGRQGQLRRPMDGGDGAFPVGDLSFDQAGNLYGATQYGPSYGGSCGCEFGPCGLIYEMTPSHGTWQENILFTFNYLSNGSAPSSGVVFDRSHAMYGTTAYSANYLGGYGEVWSNGGVFFNFPFDGSAGAGPNGIVFDSIGNVFGRTAGCFDQGGTVFKLDHYGNNFQQLESFTGFPTALIMDGAGNLFGTTYGDGLYNAGTAFKLTPGDTGWTYTKLHDFTGGTDGKNPSDLILDGNGNLWGTAAEGGTGWCRGYGYTGCGVIFEITP